MDFAENLTTGGTPNSERETAERAVGSEPAEPVAISLTLRPAINAALWANHVPVLAELNFCNSGPDALGDVELEMASVPAAILPRTWRLAAVGPGQVRTVSDLDVRLDGSWLSSLTEAVRGCVTVSARAGGRTIAEVRRDVRFLAHNEWGGATSMLDLLAAFVEPNDPAVPRILRTASDLLRAEGKRDGLEGYQSGTKERVWEQAAAIWSAVCSLDVRYVNPPPSFELHGQRIRPPRQIMDERLATCLDLAVLFAACLEHAGLRPLLVLTKGHAFAGVWLSRRDFGTSVADDAPNLRTRLALDDVLLFETTLCSQSPAPGFRRACTAGEALVAIGRDDEFEAVIDVFRARQRRIVPVGVPGAAYARKPDETDVQGGASAPVGPPAIEEPPVLRGDPEAEEVEVSPATPESRLARWRTRLLDLTGRNRLLNLRLGGKQALAVDCPDPSRLEDMLAAMRGKTKAPPLRLRPWPDLMSGSDPRSSRIHRDRLGVDENRSFAIQALAKRELLVGRDEEALGAALTEVYRTSRAAQQEGGTNTLFLTIGTLLWRPKGKDKALRAPLILVPVILDRPSVRSGFELRAHDDETRINTTLLEMLRQEFDVHLPGLDESLPQDGSGIDVTAILDAFRRKVREIPGWEVADEVALTNLSFTKYLMWKDLADRAAALRESEVARRLMDGAGAQPTEPVAASAPRGRKESDHAGAALDDDPAAVELVCPMEADSSQLGAVAAAARGESFVLIGPPGTGKSQSITNIIANTMAQGRSVLFVAEKRAALEVVQRRLKHTGLGDFCLDLFSAKASKAAVLAQLDRAQHAGQHLDEAEWRQAVEEVAALRAELNGYVRELHRRWRNGWTAYRAIGCQLRAESGGVPLVGLHWLAADTHHAGDYSKLVEAVEDAAATLSRIGAASNRSVLTGVEHTDWSPTWQAELIEASRTAAMALDALGSTFGPAARALRVEDGPPTRATCDALDRLAELVLDPGAPDTAWALSEDAGELREPLRRAAELAQEHASLVTGLGHRWRVTATQLPVAELLAEWREAANRWLLPRLSSRKSVRARLAAEVTGDVPKHPEADLAKLTEMKAKEAELATIGLVVGPKLGARWRGFQTDFGALEAARQLASGLRGAAAACASDPASLLELQRHLHLLLSGAVELLSEAGSAGAPLRRYRRIKGALQDAFRVLEALCGTGPGAVAGEAAPDWPGHVAAHLRRWADGARHLRDWCAWRGIVQRADSLGLSPMLAALEGGSVETRDAGRVFEASYARWWVAAAATDLPRLRSFVAANHEKRIERFRALDARLLDLSTRLCRARLASGVPDEPERQRSAEYALLSRELAKKQRHIPVRQLLARMPGAIRTLTPCLMMSPLSVAQYLPADAAPFDLVVFDEASQLPTWDAIGAVGRGRQVIVVGDPKQLPPTRFFERQIPDSGEDGEGRFAVETEDLESILDECLGAGVPSRELTWHYRSRHESLIAFSNQTYYGGRLVTFPSPVVRDSAVSYCHVPGAIYARAAARTNQVEARAVVDEVVERLRRMAAGAREQSIGIVTFNSEQQSLVEDLLDKARRDDPSLERFFSEDQIEPVLVKNLEGVQGEERDLVFFSLTYGPDSSGRLAMNFGPLNQTGGERRLNVAVTRAREGLVVFGSFRPEQIDLSRTSAVGVTHLRRFLSFAERGAQAFAAGDGISVGDFESPFESSVAEALRAKGWFVHPQIGVSAFRVDLGVVDPDAPGEFLAGVECDGATYHRAASARDRDRLREAVLESLGWHVLRVWSTDWWTNAHREAERLHELLGGILERNRARRATGLDATRLSAESTQGASCGGDGEVAPKPDEDAEANLIEPTMSPTAELAVDADATRFYDEGYRPQLTAIIEGILRAEAPMRDERLAQRVARAHGFQRTGGRIRDAVMAALPSSCSRTSEAGAVFVWPPGADPSSWSGFRQPPPGEQREPAEIAMPELIALAKRVVTDAADDEAALLRMRAACGLSQLRAVSRTRCLLALQAVRAGQSEQL